MIKEDLEYFKRRFMLDRFNKLVEKEMYEIFIFNLKCLTAIIEEEDIIANINNNTYKNIFSYLSLAFAESIISIENDYIVNSRYGHCVKFELLPNIILIQARGDKSPDVKSNFLGCATLIPQRIEMTMHINPTDVLAGKIGFFDYIEQLKDAYVEIIMKSKTEAHMVALDRKVLKMNYVIFIEGNTGNSTIPWHAINFTNSKNIEEIKYSINFCVGLIGKLE